MVTPLQGRDQLAQGQLQAQLCRRRQGAKADFPSKETAAALEEPRRAR